MRAVSRATGEGHDRLEFRRHIPLTAAAGDIANRERSTINIERLLRIELANGLSAAGNCNRPVADVLQLHPIETLIIWQSGSWAALNCAVVARVVAVPV